MPACRYWIREWRLCAWCKIRFLATRRGVSYCSATCGYYARGLDANGGPKKVAA